MHRLFINLHRATIVVAGIILIGCANTTVRITPLPQTPICNSALSALVLWSPQWRPNQKDVSERETAAEAGLRAFLQASGCFKNSEFRRLPSITPPIVAAEVDSAKRQFDKVVSITVRELGPVIKLLASLALIDGGTEVVLQIAEYTVPGGTQTRGFTVHWEHGGPGVIKGVASLPQDMQAALIMGLRPR